MNQTEFHKLKQDLQDSYDRLDQIKDVLDQAKDSTDLFDLLFKKRVWGDLTPKQAKNNFDLLDKLITLNDQFAMTNIERDWHRYIPSTISDNDHNLLVHGNSFLFQIYSGNLDRLDSVNGVTLKIPYWGYDRDISVEDLLINHDEPIKVNISLQISINFFNLPKKLRCKYKGHYLTRLDSQYGCSDYSFYPFSVPNAKLQLIKDKIYLTEVLGVGTNWNKQYCNLQSTLGDWEENIMNNRKLGDPATIEMLHKIREVQKAGSTIYKGFLPFPAKRATKKMAKMLPDLDFVLAKNPKLFDLDKKFNFINQLKLDTEKLIDQAVRITFDKIVKPDIERLYKKVFNQEVKVEFTIEERYWKIIDFGDNCDWIVNPF